MSDMKTFTVRDLDRTPAKVLAAADRDGVARVRQRNGRAYEVRPAPTISAKPDWPEFARQRREAIAQLRMPRISKSLATKLDLLIAGE
ncbi:MAG: hypothetical protein JWM35_1819 [Verrucomicrobia bacterium]|nr:hypothetical protein [Verrucomicrobiota bacterium]